MEKTYNFFFGPIRNRKTVVCHFLHGSELIIKEVGNDFIITAEGHEEGERMIGNEAYATTLSANYFGNYCDFPGINENRGDKETLEGLLIYYEEIQKVENFRFILTVEESFINSSNSSLFFSFTRDFLEMFGLTSNSAPGIHLLITKSSQKYIEKLPETMRRRFSRHENFIIEGIKRNTIGISSFDLPVMNEMEYIFSQENRQNIIDNINNTDVINNKHIKFNLLSNIFLSIDRIKNNPPYSISFLSEIRDDPTMNFKNILVIDEDIDECIEKLEITSSTIIVKVLNSKRYVTIRYENNPTIKFLPSVKKVINSTSLVLTTARISNKNEFLDPNIIGFKESYNYVRLESICINSWFIENRTLNNKFLDLIVYFNLHFGTISIDEQWDIKKVTSDIWMKFYINECMKTKDEIQNTYCSLRNSEDVRYYLARMNKTENNEEMVEFLEKYIINMPSIFEIFMKPSYFKQLSYISSEVRSLREIRKMLILKYLNLVADIRSNKIQVDDEMFRKYYDSLKMFLLEFCCFNEEIVNGNTILANKIDAFMMGTNYDKSVDKFLKLFYALSLTVHKLELYKYEISGDISTYQNFQALVAGINKGKIFIGKNNVRLSSAIPLISSTIIAALLTTKPFSAPIGATVFVVGIGINIISALLKSGYYSNSIKFEGKDICLDCRVGFK
ncbi:hypothetical protein SteCoe_37071 [Stentor coeruleus]|uniref:Uncharacterized protein n=1 Tax=Stentor coeruleus TaxID=5963 RepID=A0A1R2ANT9_9CILI|nr:hypothetical protein SteCoe_37071 [Stentor coeruleus]